jgi:glycosyltransferase involved in cell wall biosynthesis
MNTPMKFSIVTCTWNSEPYLAQSIASVLAQDYPHIEYIFVDGGSTDGTLERIQRVPRPVELIRDVRGGISRAMNRGIAAATGDVIAHLHSDDYYLHPRVLSRVCAALTSTARKWAVGGCLPLRDGKLQPRDPRPWLYSYFNLLTARIHIPHPALFVRRELWQEVGVFDETIQLAMDIDLCLRMARKFDPVILDEDLAAFREHPGSRSTANAWVAKSEEMRVRRKYALRHPLAISIGLARCWVRRRRWLRAQNAS